MNRFLWKKNRGVTFIELMIVIVIVGILAGFAVPQFGGLMKRQSLLSESRRITSLLKLARSEARARGAYVVLSRPAGADWSGTIEMYESISGGDTAFVPSADQSDPANDEMIRRARSSGRVLSADASLPAEFITFNPRGWVKDEFTLAVCSSAGNSDFGRFIEVNRVGKISERPIETNDSCTQ